MKDGASSAAPAVPAAWRGLSTIVSQRAQQTPDLELYRFSDYGDETALTCAALERKAFAAAGAMLERVPRGSRALLIYPPGLEFVSAFFGCVCAGMVAVPVVPPWLGRGRDHLAALMGIFEDADPAIVLTTAALENEVRSVLAGVPGAKRVHCLATDAVENDDVDVIGTPTYRDELALLQYTSGSTGSPKGVMVTHGNLVANVAAMTARFQSTAEDVAVAWIPPYHDMGLIGGLLLPLYAGFPMVLMSPLEFIKRPISWLKAITHYRATVSPAPNFAFDLCVRRTTAAERETLDLSSWTLAPVSAEPVFAGTLESFARVFEPCGFRKEAFNPCYGLAEATLIVTGGERAAPVRLGDRRESEHVGPPLIVSCGAPVAGAMVVIVDGATQRAVPDGSIGEIWIRGSTVAGGYFEKPVESMRTFGATLEGGRERFLRTGDLGFFENGELFVTGRIKDLIVVRGRKHHPQDIERTVAASHDALRAGCVAAFSARDEDRAMEEIVVVAEANQDPVTDRLQREIHEAVRASIATEHGLSLGALHLLPRGSILKTSSGKLRRTETREQFAALGGGRP